MQRIFVCREISLAGTTGSLSVHLAHARVWSIPTLLRAARRFDSLGEKGVCRSHHAEPGQGLSVDHSKRTLDERVQLAATADAPSSHSVRQRSGCRVTRVRTPCFSRTPPRPVGSALRLQLPVGLHKMTGSYCEADGSVRSFYGVGRICLQDPC